MPSAVEELGKAIGHNISDTESMNQSMSHSAGEDTNVIFPTDIFEVKELVLRLSGNDIGTAFILGHPDNGLLGTSKLGAGTYSFTGEDWRVVSPDNTFWDYLATTTNKNTADSTSTHNDSTEEELFTPGQIYLTKRIFKNELDIYVVKPKIWIRSAEKVIVIDTIVPEQELNIYTE